MPNRQRFADMCGLQRVLSGTITCVCILLGSCNPFAPTYDPAGLDAFNTLGDPTNLNGFFRLFKSAYELRDTALYGRLFSADFTFTYYNADKGQDVSWDRGVEMNTSYRLFQGVQQINLDWNFYSQFDTTALDAYVVRNFNLSIIKDESTIFVGTGRARMRLRRAVASDPWKAYYWFDDSDF